MKRRIVLGLAGLLGLLVSLGAVVYLLGAALPEEHVAEGVVESDLSPEALFDKITDFEHGDDWRTEVSEVKLLELRGGHPVYQEVGPRGALRYKVIELLEPSRVVTEIVDSPDFGGTWTFEVEPTATGSRLTIREDGFVPNPIFRFFARYLFGYQSSIDSYLASVSRLANERPGQPF